LVISFPSGFDFFELFFFSRAIFVAPVKPIPKEGGGGQKKKRVSFFGGLPSRLRSLWRERRAQLSVSSSERITRLFFCPNYFFFGKKKFRTPLTL
jgi:hypothetical protein